MTPVHTLAPATAAITKQIIGGRSQTHSYSRLVIDLTIDCCSLYGSTFKILRIVSASVMTLWSLPAPVISRISRICFVVKPAARTFSQIPNPFVGLPPLPLSMVFHSSTLSSRTVSNFPLDTDPAPISLVIPVIPIYQPLYPDANPFQLRRPCKPFALHRHCTECARGRI